MKELLEKMLEKRGLDVLVVMNGGVLVNVRYLFVVVRGMFVVVRGVGR